MLFDKKNFVLLVFFVFIIPVFFASIFFGGVYTNLLLLLVLVYMFFLAFLSKNRVFVFSVIFISTYFIYLIPYFFYGYAYATRENYQIDSVARINFHYIAFFVLFFLMAFYTSKCDELKLSERLVFYNNPLIYFTCLSVLCVFISLSIDFRGTALTVSYQEISEGRYPIVDYSLIFVLLAYVFGPSDKQRKILILVGFLYIVVSLLYGLRLRGIQMMLLLFILFFEVLFKPRFVFFVSLLGIFLMQWWGELRAGDAAFMQRDYVIVSNQGGVFLNANMYIGLVRDGYITTLERFTTFLGNVLSIFYSQSSLPEKYNLAALAGSYFSIPGGGLISGYMYVWGGVLGLLIGTLIISLIYRYLFSFMRNQYVLIYGVIIICTLPRWFAYNPIHFFKMAIWCVLIYKLFFIFHRVTMKYERF